VPPATTGTPTANVLLAAATKTLDAKTSKVAFRVDVSGQGVPPTTVTGQGAFDYANRRGSISLVVPNLGNLTTVIVGQTIYEQLPPALRPALGGKPWIKIDLTTIGSVAGIDLSSLSSAQSSDPSQALALLRGASSNVTVVGKETLRGESVTHYKATIDLDKAVANAPASARAGLQSVFKLLTTRSLPADVWVDDAGRLRKETFTTTLNTAGRTLTSATNYELYDFGTTVSASAPPADQTTDLGAALHQQAPPG
jgi:hypothetical protein